MATKYGERLKAFLENIKTTLSDPKNVEVLIFVDDKESSECIDSIKDGYPFVIKKQFSSKKIGYYRLNEGYNALIPLANENSYFFWLLTDEIRFCTKNWDSKIKKYIKRFDDDIFRLKLSDFRLKNYYSLFECMPCPDNYAITTRKWIQLTGGWGEFWGPDSWHQCIDYFLGFGRNGKFYPYGLCRSIPIWDIELKGLDAGKGYSAQEFVERMERIRRGWQKFTSKKYRKKYAVFAAILKTHIMMQALQIRKYRFDFNKHASVLDLRKTDVSESSQRYLEEKDIPYLSFAKIFYSQPKRYEKTIMFFLHRLGCFFVGKHVTHAVTNLIKAFISPINLMLQKINFLIFRIFSKKNKKFIYDGEQLWVGTSRSRKVFQSEDI